MLFVVVGTVSAAELNDASTKEDSNLISTDDAISSQENKLEISSEDSISATNIVNSHDDNLVSYPNEATVNVSEASNYEDNNPVQSTATNEDELTATNLESNGVSKTPTKISTKLSVYSTRYSKSASYFKLVLKDKDGKAISSGKVSLKVNGVTYSGLTNDKGIAFIKTASLKVGTYAATAKFAGDSNYLASSLSKNVKVLSSVSGNDLDKYYGYASVYQATFWKNTDALANTKVSFTVNGKTYTKTTDENGVAKLNINLAPGKYVITSTNPYSKEKLSNNIVVKKDSTTLKHDTANTYIPVNKRFTYTVTLKSNHNVLIKGARVIFKFNNDTVTTKTDQNGKASITIPILSKGTYSVSYKYSGDLRYSGSSGHGKIHVQDPRAHFTSSQLKMIYKDGSKFKVTLKDSNNKPLANKVVKFTINGDTYTSKTNQNGKASLNVGDLKPGTYTVKFKFLSMGYKYYASGKNKIIISKQTASLSAGDLEMKYNDGSVYKAVAKDKSGNPLKNVSVKFVINSKSHTVKTDSKGVAQLKINQPVGHYTIKSTISDKGYKSNDVSKHVTVKGVKFIAGDIRVHTGSNASFPVKLVNAYSNPAKNVKVTFKVDGKTYNGTTDSKGVVQVSLGVLSKGDHTIKYASGPYSGSSKIHVVNKLTVSQIVAASKTVQKYIKSNGKLPSSVKIGGVSYSTADYLYFASKAIVNLKSGSAADISIKHINNPSKSKSSSDLGYLKDYLSVAKTIVKYAESKGKMPDSVTSKVGTIGYQGVVNLASYAVAYYGAKGKLPAYVPVKSIKSSTSGSSTSNGLNSKNTIADLTAYLAASANCQVNDAKIKKLVQTLTKGLTTDKAKANAIFEYVRDTLSYSFYYNTRYGATGTLNAKSGNCVDHAHLLVAMYRAAGLPSRYVHCKCTFTSGNTYGHVWVQVLVGNTWTISDATSSRNSLGKVANWNTKSYVYQGTYTSLPF